MARWLPERLLALQVRALGAGGSVRTLYDGAHSRLVDWDIAGDCERPVLVELNGRPDDTVLSRGPIPPASWIFMWRVGAVLIACAVVPPCGAFAHLVNGGIPRERGYARSHSVPRR